MSQDTKEKERHTEGPWKVSEIRPWEVEVERKVFAEEIGRKITVTATIASMSFDRGVDGETGRANAIFIVRAANAYEALLDVAKRALEYAPNEVEAGKIRAAIAEADAR